MSVVPLPTTNAEAVRVPEVAVTVPVPEGVLKSDVTSAPLYHDFFAMLMRVPGFVLEGDTLAAMQNARALHRAMNVMRTLGR